MIKGDMAIKRERAKRKVQEAIKEKGTGFLLAGIVGTIPEFGKIAIEEGIKMIEVLPLHLAPREWRGNRQDMIANYRVRGEISRDEETLAVRTMRSMLGEEVFITVPTPGAFAEVVPIPFTEEDALALSKSGADGIHVHKFDFEDLEEITEIAHQYGLLVDAYIGNTNDEPDHTAYLGVPARSPQEVKEATQKMEDVGVDMIGLMTGLTYLGEKAGNVPPEVKERLEMLISTAHVPTLVEGGINLKNSEVLKATGVNIIVIGTFLTDVAKSAVRDTLKTFVVDHETN